MSAALEIRLKAYGSQLHRQLSRLSSSRWWLAARAALSVLLLAYIGWTVDWGGLAEAVAQGRPLVLALAPLALLSGLVLAAWRWHLLLGAVGESVGVSACLRGYLAAWFYGMFLPGFVGADAVRAGVAVSRSGVSLKHAASTILLERATGFGVLGILGGVGALLVSADPSVQLGDTLPLLLLALGVSSFVVILGGIALLPVAGAALAARFSAGSRLAGFARLGARLAGVPRRVMLTVLALSIGFQLAGVISYFLLSASIGMAVPWAFFLVLAALAYLATALPVSLGGLGVREGAIAYSLTLVGVPLGTAASFAVLVFGTLLTVGFVGALAEAVSPVRRAITGARPLGGGKVRGEQCEGAPDTEPTAQGKRAPC